MMGQENEFRGRGNMIPIQFLFSEMHDECTRLGGFSLDSVVLLKN